MTRTHTASLYFTANDTKLSRLKRDLMDLNVKCSRERESEKNKGERTLQVDF